MKDACNRTGSRLSSFELEIATAPQRRFAMTERIIYFLDSRLRNLKVIYDGNDSGE
ncbi:MAG: hypothetical protein WCO53_08760 [Deltaproteobacteria bacterium]